MVELKGKVVLITGAAGGIGLHTAGFFAEAGCPLVLTDRNAEALHEAEERLKRHNVPLFTRAMDATDLAAIQVLQREVQERFGRVDILINNAGIGFNAEMADTPLEKWQQLMAVNFWAALYHIHVFLPKMRERRSGHIVNISSGQAFFRAPTWGAYSVSKLAVAAMSEIFSVELARDNIRVTTVYPFLVNTGFYNNTTATSLGERIFYSLLPLYSHEPETVARKIFDAVREEKDIEMVSPLNLLFKYARAVSPLATIMDKSTLSVMSQKQMASLADNALTNTVRDAINALFAATKTVLPEKGFRIREVMSGEHEFIAGFGPPGKHCFEFRAEWGPDSLTDFLNPASEKFLLSTLEGTVTVGGLCENMPMQGTLQLRYFQDQKIRYEFDFCANNESYRFIGEKVQIYPWNLPYSHTTCFGEIRNLRTGETISRSVSHFALEALPEFLGSLRLVS